MINDCITNEQTRIDYDHISRTTVDKRIRALLLIHGDQFRRGRAQSHRVPKPQTMEQRIFLFRPVVGKRRGQKLAIGAVRRLPIGPVAVQSGVEEI